MRFLRFFRLSRLSCLMMLPLLLVAMSACQTTPPPGLTPEQIAQLKDSGFSETDAGWELNLDARLLFDISSATLNQKEQEALDKIARTLLSIGITQIIIEGHTDSTGTERYNHELSLKRASMVADHLASAGMPSQDMEIKAVGSAQPIASNATREGRRENRRTVIIIPSH
ncbi:MAG: OmpA family protein [Zoogloeaceae bacterium]|jgi:outer membrane protein OmpA-like peptidoglycan-associated protein|nr:OmpA family protein [Zoogloeaceae bacterium]